jgi:DNA-binding response OmpR family regulator
LIRKHSNPEIRDILIIAMTASAIEGDREKCLDSGMNNYLAKPVRAQTLKALLESYLNKESDKDIPNLEAEAKKMVKQALTEGAVNVEGETGPTKMRSRPASVRSVTQRWLGPNKKDGGSPIPPDQAGP